MRAYFFTNRYVSGIHTGIQSGHALDQMWSKYVEEFLSDQLSGQEPLYQHRSQLDLLREFSRNHKTFVILDGGDHHDLLKLRDLLDRPDNPYPWGEFQEPGLNHCLTSVVVVIPEALYKSVDTEISQLQLTAWEREFQEYRISRPLAR